ncbi:MAG TPA: FAD-dependent oxidoreductase [Candidatus Krumholzibacteria bacterium]
MTNAPSPARRVVIAGAGCAGLAAGLALQKRGFDTVILERSNRVGGLAGGIEINGNTYEYGPHIFHTTDPEILADVKTICKDVLEPFERTIKIKFGGRYFDYPLSPLDILTKLPPLTVVRACVSLAWHFTCGIGRDDTFENSEQALRRYYGDVLYRIFFRDYIHKVWGIGPQELAPSFAKQRLPRFSVRRALGGVWRRFFPEGPKEISVEGYVENVEGEHFTTPKGFSLICEAFAAEYEKHGGELRLRAAVNRIEVSGRRCTSVTFVEGGAERSEACDWFVSTMPISAMPGMIHPPASEALLEASRQLRFRAIVFVGILVKKQGALPASFMYFRDKTFNRITDLTRFKVIVNPPGSTILVAEITCQSTDRAWTDEEATARTVVEELVGDGFLEQSDVIETHVFKAEHGYPIYRVGYEEHLAKTLAGIGELENVASIGRQGRFAYVNTHVAMKMGYELARRMTTEV